MPSAGGLSPPFATALLVWKVPWIAKMPAKITNAITRFTSGPAEITTTRFQTGIRKYARSWCSGGISSVGFIPVIRT